MRSAALALAFVALCATCALANVDCEGMKEPARTACFDRNAEMNIQSPVTDEVSPVAPPMEDEDEDQIDDEADSGDALDDVMGDLGESDKASAKATAKTEMRAELKEAESTTAHMYDDDVKVARAFSGLDDEMDDLKMHLHHLHTSMKVDDSEEQTRDEIDREEEEEEASRESELGEAGNIKAAAARPDTSGGVLDMNADDLSKDLSVDFHTRTANNMDKVDNLMDSLRSASGEQVVPDVELLDEATEFLQFSDSQNLESQDLAHSKDSLFSRAELEATQANSMEDEDEDQSEAKDMGESISDGDKDAADLDDLDMTFADKPSLDIGDSNGRRDAEMVIAGEEQGHDIGSMAQDAALNTATSYVSEEDKREEDAIKKAQAHEKKMEQDAKAHMYAEMQKMKSETTQDKKSLAKAVREHKQEKVEKN